MADNNVTPIPYELEPAQPGGCVTRAEFIKDGDRNQHEINEEMVTEAPSDDGMYVRKNGIWSKLEIEYDESTETLIINTEPVNNV